MLTCVGLGGALMAEVTPSGLVKFASVEIVIQRVGYIPFCGICLRKLGYSGPTHDIGTNSAKLIV